MDNGDEAATAASFAAVGAPDGEFRAFTAFYAACRQLTEALWPTMTSPLLPRSEARSLAARAGAAEAWEAMIEHPIGHAISKELRSDLVRGVVLTDALIGTFARADDEDLQQNICFLYHLIGGGTGDWDVPVGGMGAVSGELERAARDAGATILTSADVTAVRPGGVVDYRHGGQDHSSSARWVLSNVAPAVLDGLRGRRAVLRRRRAAGISAGADPATRTTAARARRSRSTFCSNGSPGCWTDPSARRPPSAGRSTSTRPGPSSTPPTAAPPPDPCPRRCRAKSTATR